MSNKIDKSKVYFAKADSKTCASTLIGKADSFFNLLRGNAFLSKLNDMWMAYHGAYNKDVGYGHQITFTGEQGELVQLSVNHFRNLARHMYNLVTANRPIMEARAINTDYKSLAQTYLANGILDYYMREKGVELSLNKAVEMAIVLGAGFIKAEWNATAGETYDVDPETGEYNYEGEIEFTNLSPLDVIFDGTKENWKDNEWIMVRSWQNRHNLIAKYPEYADKLQAMAPKNQSAVYRLAVWSNDDTDDIPVYEFFHKKTEAVPEGRYILFVDSEIILMDTDLPYKILPIFRISPSDIMGTPYGYSDMFDVLPIQEALNASYSAVMTNHNAFSVQNVFVPRGADINISAISGELNIIEGNAKPEPLNLVQTPKEVFEFIQILENMAETMAGINSVTRGNPEASLKSGTALALVQSMSLQFINPLQQSYVRLVEDVGTAIIQMLKEFANTPRLVALVGRNNRPLLKEFTGDQIGSINRVVVDMGNALSRTIAGRVQMADQLAQMKLLKNPNQYFQVMNTGRLDSLFEGEMSELLLIKSENERLMEGEMVMASIFDAHREHIMEHKAVMADPDLRKDPVLLRNAQEHMQQHIELLRNGDPDLLQLLGQQPLNPPMMPGDPNLPPGPMNNQEVLEQNPIPGVVNQQPPSIPGQPNLPQVDEELLPNPAAQESFMNNLRR